MGRRGWRLQQMNRWSKREALSRTLAATLIMSPAPAPAQATYPLTPLGGGNRPAPAPTFPAP